MIKEILHRLIVKNGWSTEVKKNKKKKQRLKILSLTYFLKFKTRENIRMSKWW